MAGWLCWFFALDTGKKFTASRVTGAMSNDIFATILSLYQDDLRNPFPYTDCRKIRSLAGVKLEDLIPDLDMYFADLAGYCSRGNRIARMSPQEFLNLKEAASQSFFEKHPQYQSIRALITEKDTPDLFKDLDLHERMRFALLEIFELHIADQSY